MTFEKSNTIHFTFMRGKSLPYSPSRVLRRAHRVVAEVVEGQGGAGLRGRVGGLPAGPRWGELPGPGGLGGRTRPGDLLNSGGVQRGGPSLLAIPSQRAMELEYLSSQPTGPFEGYSKWWKRVIYRYYPKKTTYACSDDEVVKNVAMKAMESSQAFSW